MTDRATRVDIRSRRFGPVDISYDGRVLEPRDWTLAQSTWAAELCRDLPPGPIVELCAGAGQIGLAAAVLADRDLVQVEADAVAAEYARTNAVTAGRRSRVEVRHAPLEGALLPHERFGLILADPPYLRSTELARWPDDPSTAIDGGADGLDVIRACLEVAHRHLAPGGRLLLQVAGARQAAQVSELLPALGLHPVELRETDEVRAILLIA